MFHSHFHWRCHSFHATIHHFHIGPTSNTQSTSPMPTMPPKSSWCNGLVPKHWHTLNGWAWSDSLWHPLFWQLSRSTTTSPSLVNTKHEGKKQTPFFSSVKINACYYSNCIVFIAHSRYCITWMIGLQVERYILLKLGLGRWPRQGHDAMHGFWDGANSRYNTWWGKCRVSTSFCCWLRCTTEQNPSNMLCTHLTEEAFHSPKEWLKDSAEWNIDIMLVTEETSLVVILVATSVIVKLSSGWSARKCFIA